MWGGGAVVVAAAAAAAASSPSKKQMCAVRRRWKRWRNDKVAEHKDTAEGSKRLFGHPDGSDRTNGRVIVLEGPGEAHSMGHAS